MGHDWLEKEGQIDFILDRPASLNAVNDPILVLEEA
jgi:hypothetical protein